MPWTERQVRVAQAVRHGWKPRGAAKGFTREFAEQVVDEGVKGKRKPRNLAELARRK